MFSQQLLFTNVYYKKKRKMYLSIRQYGLGNCNPFAVFIYMLPKSIQMWLVNRNQGTEARKLTIQNIFSLAWMLCLPLWRFAACLCLLHNLSLVLAKSGYLKASLWSHFDHCGAVDTLVISGIKSNIILKIINMQIRKQSLSDLPHSHLKWIQQMIKCKTND